MAHICPVAAGSFLWPSDRVARIEAQYPRQIIDSLGGAYAMTLLSEIDEVPGDGLYLFDLRDGPDVFLPPAGPAVRLGHDVHNNPLLEIHVPDFKPLLLYCRRGSTGGFTNLHSWMLCDRIQVGWSLGDMAHTILELLTQVQQGQGYAHNRRFIHERLNSHRENV